MRRQLCVDGPSSSVVCCAFRNARDEVFDFPWVTSNEEPNAWFAGCLAAAVFNGDTAVSVCVTRGVGRVVCVPEELACPLGVGFEGALERFQEVFGGRGEACRGCGRGVVDPCLNSGLVSVPVEQGQTHGASQGESNGGAVQNGERNGFLLRGRRKDTFLRDECYNARVKG